MNETLTHSRKPPPRDARADDVPEEPKPRLLIVGPLPPPYIGPAVATERLLRSPYLAERFDVLFLDTSDPGGLDDIGQFSMRNVGVALRHALDCWRTLLLRRPEIIYIPIARGLWGFLRDLLFLLPSRLMGVRVLVHLRAGRFDLRHDHGALGRLIARVGLASATRGIVLGETVRDVFGDNISRDRIRVMPNGIDLLRWGTRDASSRESASSFHITYLANLFEDKGAHVMLAALPRIVERIPSVRVTFAGQFSDREYYARCLDFVRANGLEPYVEFVGGVDEEQKKRLLFDSDLAVFVPVKPEGLPWVILEAMASSLPVVGTPQGTMKEVIVHGETGFLVAPGNPDELADRVAELAHDPDLRHRLGTSARDRIETFYSEAATHRRLVEIALETLGGEHALPHS